LKEFGQSNGIHVDWKLSPYRDSFHSEDKAVRSAGKRRCTDQFGDMSWRPRWKWVGTRRKQYMVDEKNLVNGREYKFGHWKGLADD
jgi:hypothetical protein